MLDKNQLIESSKEIISAINSLNNALNSQIRSQAFNEEDIDRKRKILGRIMDDYLSDMYSRYPDTIPDIYKDLDWHERSSLGLSQ